MSWSHYRLVFRLESPLHIGWRKAGNLMQTRRYVPGKNLWAALTEALVHRAGRGHEGQAYQDVGKELKQHFRFGYLWPAHGEQNPDGSWQAPTQPHFPWDESDPEYWDYLYLDGTARTALDAMARTAAEGMLYEIEFLAPYTREGQPVYLVGDLWVQTEMLSTEGNGSTIPLQWEQALQRLQIGGERGYGWGRIRLVKCEKTPQSSHLSWGNLWEWSEMNGEVVLSIGKNANANDKPIRIPAHALAVDFEGQRAVQGVQGKVEPWLGWERTPNDVRLAQACIMYAPGARVSGMPPGFRLHTWGYLEGAPKASAARAGAA